MASIQRDTNPEELFEVLERLGEGSYGKVYKALARGTAEVVALKIVPSESDDDAAFGDLTKEIHVLERCESPHIVRYYKSFLYDAHLWIAMEFCAAGSIADLLTLRRRPLTEPQIAAVCASVVKGLAYLHASRHIHRDIKAGNILLSGQGLAKLADFGVSAQLTTTINKRRTVIGTPFWMAPEVIQESQYDHKADVWSLGITAIEMAEGKPPLAHMHPMRAVFLIPTRAPPTLQAQDAYSPAFHDFLRVCLQKDAHQRPEATELLQHAFLRKHAKQLHDGAGGLPLLQELVDESLEMIQEARDEQLQDEYEFRSTLTGRVDGSLSIADVSTLLRRGGGGMSLSSTLSVPSRSGTMVFAGGSDTMVKPYDSDTMVPCPPPPAPSHLGFESGGDETDGSDTLVCAKPTTRDPTQEDDGSEDYTTTEPSFMKYFRVQRQQDEHEPALADAAKSSTIRPVAVSAVDQLRTLHEQLQNLEDQYNRDQRDLRTKYEHARATLEHELDALACI
jgi:serine/threonine kinase 4